MTVRPRVGFVVPVLVTMASATSAAQDARLERLAEETRPQVVRLIDSARTAGLPPEPLVQRALEGATKHASGELIVTALRRLAGDLGRARDALGAAASPAELSAGAAALRAGSPPAVLAELRRTRHEPLTVPLAVLTDLVASGVPADSAAAAVLALAARVRDPELIEFRRAVERDIALGASPGAAAWADALAASASGVTATGAHGGQPLPPRKP